MWGRGTARHDPELMLRLRLHRLEVLVSEPSWNDLLTASLGRRRGTQEGNLVAGIGARDEHYPRPPTREVFRPARSRPSASARRLHHHGCPFIVTVTIAVVITITTVVAICITCCVGHRCPMLPPAFTMGEHHHVLGPRRQRNGHDVVAAGRGMPPGEDSPLSLVGTLCVSQPSPPDGPRLQANNTGILRCTFRRASGRSRRTWPGVWETP